MSALKMRHVYSLATGAFTGMSFATPDDEVDANVPEGCGAILADLVTDVQSQRVDLATGQVIDWQPPQPEGDVYRAAVWDAAVRRWVWTDTPAAAVRDALARRAAELAASDWVTLRAIDTGIPVPAAWAAYRQALRDLPAQPGWPDVIWPDEPPR
ncbi:MAG: hypothetical protein RLY78_4243 [Pseudomonadota bacterium]|jgi:hypothetical protein